MVLVAGLDVASMGEAESKGQGMGLSSGSGGKRGRTTMIAGIRRALRKMVENM
jgi:hypothetical protein